MTNLELTAAIKRFVQSKARYKTSYYERVKWDAYGSARRIAYRQGWPTVDSYGALIAILDYYGVSYRQSELRSQSERQQADRAAYRQAIIEIA